MTFELESLRSVADRVHPPSFEALEEVARKRTRRAAVAATLGCVVAVLVTVVGIAAATAGDDRSAPGPVIPPTPTPTVTSSPTPTPDPKPTHRSDSSMTPAEVVAADDATLLMTGASLDDPAFRLSVWQAVCHWCPRGETTPIYQALAITSDAFTTVVYRRPPFDTGAEHVVSVGPGLLAIVDQSNGFEWLVRDDGTITPLARDFEQRPAAEPHLWVVCLGNTGNTVTGQGPGAATPFDSQPTWCAVDPDANAIHIWQGPWAGTLDDSESLVSPAPDRVPWGVRDPTYSPTLPAPEVDRAQVWWEADGSRHRHDLGPITAMGPVLNGQPGLMSCWTWVEDSPTISVFTRTDQGDTWKVVSLGVPFRPDNYGALDLSWTPGGDLVARRTAHRDGLQLYRAQAVDGGAFELVLDVASGYVWGWVDLPFVVLGPRIVASRVWSDDDGRSWTELSPWR